MSWEECGASSAVLWASCVHWLCRERCTCYQSPFFKKQMMSSRVAMEDIAVMTLSFLSLLGSICEGGCSGIKDRAGNPNIQGMGPAEQAGGNIAGNDGERRNLEELLDSELPAASQLSLVWEWPSFLLMIFLFLFLNTNPGDNPKPAALAQEVFASVPSCLIRRSVNLDVVP